MNTVSLRSLFNFTDAHVREGATEEARKSAGENAALPRWVNFAAEGAADKLNETLNVDVFDLLAEGWVKFKEIKDSAKASKQGQGKQKPVSLRDVEITSTNAPFLQAKINGLPVPELRFELDLTAKFKVLEFEIENGYITLIRPTAASAVVCLKYGKKTLVTTPSKDLNLLGEIPLPGKGIPIPGVAN